MKVNYEPSYYFYVYTKQFIHLSLWIVGAQLKRTADVFCLSVSG
jgi:hypothetical protein